MNSSRDITASDALVRTQDHEVSGEAWRARERIVRRFEEAWARGTPPEVEAFLPDDPEERRGVLPELLAVDAELRRRHGLPARGVEPRRIDKYELLEIVGTGSFGVVWRARDTELGRTVAVKVPRSGTLTEADVERFLREARGAARLAHPNVVTVHDAGRQGDSCFLVTEFIEGKTLHQRLSSGPFEVRSAAEVVAALADALECAHAQGVIHRDVKPANVLLDVDGQPHLADFGLARLDAADATLAATGVILGTPGYMSPEQARGDGRTIDSRTDLYSLGVILYEMLTGERPFRGAGRGLLLRVMEEEPDPPRRLRDGVPRDLDTICLKCLEKEPEQRYATAKELAEDLRRFLHGEPVRARPLSFFGRLERQVRRRPLAAALAATLTLVTLVGVGGVLWQWRAAVTNFERAEDQRQRAEANQQQAEAILVELQATLQGWTADDWELRRSAAMEKVITHYETMRAARPDDERLKTQLLSTLLGAGDLASASWDLPAANHRLSAAVELAEELVRLHPGDQEYRYQLAAAHLGLAWIEDWNQQPEWVARAEKSRVIFEELHAEGAWKGRAVPAVVTHLGSLYSLLESRGRREDSRCVSELLAKVLEESLQVDPKLAGGRLYLASLHFRTGQALYISNQYARALPIFAATATLLEQVCRDEPLNIAAHLLLARTYSFLGYQERDLNCPQKAVDWYERSVEVYEKALLPNAKTAAQFRGDYVGTLHNLAKARRQIGDESRASAALSKAVEELEPAINSRTDAMPANPGSIQFRESLVSLHLTLGRIQRDRGDRKAALLAFTEARRLSVGHGRNLYRVASDFALCSTSDEGTMNLTMQVLQEAVAAGYRNVRELREDSDFVAFRSRDDFRRLLAEMEKGTTRPAPAR